MPAQASFFARHVRDAMSAPPLMLPLGMECGAAVARMAALAASCAAVVDAEGRPIGLLTDQDVTRRIAFQVPSGAPVEATPSTSSSTSHQFDGTIRPDRIEARASAAASSRARFVAGQQRKAQVESRRRDAPRPGTVRLQFDDHVAGDLLGPGSLPTPALSLRTSVLRGSYW